MSKKNSMKWIIIEIISKSYKGKKIPYIITYLVYLFIYIFVKDISQSISRKSATKLFRVYKIKYRQNQNSIAKRP